VSVVVSLRLHVNSTCALAIPVGCDDMPRLEFRVLGPVGVWRDRKPVALGNGVLLSALTGLLISAGQIVSADTLVELIWGESMPDHPRGALHNVISRLRRHINDGSLETLPGGYRIRSDAEHLDLLRFDELLAACAEAEDNGAPDVAVVEIEKALELWREPLLGNVQTSALNRVAVHLAERYLAAREHWAELCLRLNRPEQVTQKLSHLVESHPFRERMVGQLMVGLLRTGRQADALAYYERLRHSLAEELGIEPGRALQDLYLGILRADPNVVGKEQAYIDGPIPGDVIPRQLPPDIADFTGRDDEAAQVVNALSRGVVPIVIIAGQGGVGKTAMAVHSAHMLASFPAFGDGQLYADLRSSDGSLVDPNTVLAGFLRSLGVESSTVPEGQDERVALYRSLLAERSVLVVLDSVESERQIRPLLPGGLKCAVIVTSRFRLTGLPGARLIDLDVFDDSHAMAFLGRLISIERLAAESHDAHKIIHQCGGLPLALRIAGARLAARPHWHLAVLAERLTNTCRRLDELRYGDLDLRATIALSYNGLTAPAKTLLRRLSLLDVSDFPVQIGAALLDSDVERAEELFDALLNARLLDICEKGNSGSWRYCFAVLIRPYAQERAIEEDTLVELDSALMRAFGCQLALME
jgi:DNA-binding SARP family transcriptional activator